MNTKEQLLQEIKECFINFAGVDKLRELVEKAFDSGVLPLDLTSAMKEALDTIGGLYEKGQYFLSDLIMSGIMATEFTNMVKPYLAVNTSSLGKVLIGTVQGDIHDIGKNLTATMLSSQGFDVVDVGVDVAPEKFLEGVLEHEPCILAMSCLLTIGMPHMQRTIELVRKNRPRIETMVGGRPINQEFANKIGAGGYGRDAFEAGRIARMLVGARQ